MALYGDVYIPGSSQCVKFVPFHPKNLPKGRCLSYLEDPGINNYSIYSFTVDKEDWMGYEGWGFVGLQSLFDINWIVCFVCFLLYGIRFEITNVSFGNLRVYPYMDDIGYLF